MRRGIAWFFPVTFTLVCAVGCSEKNTTTPEQIVAQYRPQLEPLEAKLRKLAALLPEDAEIVPQKLDPPLVFGPDSYGSPRPDTNAILLEYEWLDEPVTKEDASLGPPSPLHYALYWLKTPPADDGKGNGSMRKTVEQSLKTRFAVVLRNQGEVAPHLVDEHTFRPGSATARVYVYDLVADKLVGAIKIVATNPDRVDYSYSPSEDKRAEAEKALLESVKADRAAKLDKAVKALGDGKWGYY